LAYAYAKRRIREGMSPAEAVRTACDQYRSAITTTAEIRMLKQLRKESK
jgi:hypothetical protein